MSIGSGHEPSVLEELSALADGELDSAAAAHACAAWREDGRVRATWHAYQLIGDVLRSDDLAMRPGRDAAFLAALRARLADEPVVLALHPSTVSAGEQAAVPVARARRRTPRWAWLVPSAVAAGFVLVAGAALLVMREPTAGSSAVQGPVVAAASAVDAVPATAIRVVPRQLSSSGRVIRDPRLDRYLAAHQHFAGTSALGMSSGLVRNAAAEDSPR